MAVVGPSVGSTLHMSSWLDRVLSGGAGGEVELVRRYSHRLMGLARKQLPARVRTRLDAEDVVQSVYRTFFRRLNDGEFAFDDSHDLWQLLAAITFRKARNAVKFHHRQRRDVRRERPLAPGTGADDEELPDPSDSDLDVLFSSLEELLAGLPDTHRAIVVARLEGESVDAIAQRVRRTRQTVSRVLSQVRKYASARVEELP